MKILEVLILIALVLLVEKSSDKTGEMIQHLKSLTCSGRGFEFSA